MGWLAGLGVFNDLFRKMAGRPASRHPYLTVVAEEQTTRNLARYFRYSLDHKVVGIQYLVGMIIYFLTAGLFAMAIRVELLSPSYHVLSPSAYLMVVGEHGTMMMMMMTSVVMGPFGNYLVPLMIGSKRVAFPRIEALSFWLTPAAFIILLSGRPVRRLPHRLDRIRATVHPGRPWYGLLRRRVRADGDLGHPRRRSTSS